MVNTGLHGIHHVPRPSLGEDDLHGLWRSFDKELTKGIHEYFSWYDLEGVSREFAGFGWIWCELAYESVSLWCDFSCMIL